MLVAVYAQDTSHFYARGKTTTSVIRSPSRRRRGSQSVDVKVRNTSEQSVEIISKSPLSFKLSPKSWIGGSLIMSNNVELNGIVSGYMYFK